MVDQFENWLKKSAPEVPDSELEEKIQRAVLGERILSLQMNLTNRRRRVGIYTAVMVLTLIVTGQVVEVGSDGFGVNLVKTIELPTADGGVREHTIFESKFTGNRVSSYIGTAEDARKTMEIASGSVSAPRSVTRWAYAGGWNWMMTYYDPERDNWVLTSPPGVESKPNEVFDDFMIANSIKYAQMLERGEGKKVGTFVKFIEGIEYSFTKWEFLTPDSQVVEIWEGVPSR